MKSEKGNIIKKFQNTGRWNNSALVSWWFLNNDKISMSLECFLGPFFKIKSYKSAINLPYKKSFNNAIIFLDLKLIWLLTPSHTYSFSNFVFCFKNKSILKDF